MTMAPTLAGNAVRSRRRLESRTRGAALEIVILALTASACLLLFADGGLEALLGAVIGMVAAARSSRGILSGAFAGFFVGALFAGFFHNALASAFSAFL